MRNSALRLFILSGLILFGSLYYYSGEVEEHYAENARKYLDGALTRMSDWQPGSLKGELARETLLHVSDSQLQALTEEYRYLDTYQSMEELRFSRLSGALSLFADAPRLSYSALIHFSGGDAIMTATLTVEDERFKIYNLNFGKP